MANHDAIVLPSLLEETERSRSAGSDASDITPVAEMASREHIQTLQLTSYVSSGRTWDVYETSVPGVLAKVCCPDTDSLYPPFDRYGEGYEDGEDAHNSSASSSSRASRMKQLYSSILKIPVMSLAWAGSGLARLRRVQDGGGTSWLCCWKMYEEILEAVYPFEHGRN